MQKNIKILILNGFGINADKELGWAFQKAGGHVDHVHLNHLITGEKKLDDYHILAFPGGFSFGDHIASGKVLANIVKHNLIREIEKFIADNKLIIGICNGFQVLVKMGLIPNLGKNYKIEASLSYNDSGLFEDRWVYLKKTSNHSPWLKNRDFFYMPVRHGEGKFIAKNNDILKKINENSCIALQYVNENGNYSVYPHNPNGSDMHIAGITSKCGKIFGLMPHPEVFIFAEQHPHFFRKNITEKDTCMPIFENGINYCRQL